MTRLTQDQLIALKEANPLDALIEARGVKLGRSDASGVRDCQCLCNPVKGKRPAYVNTRTHVFGCLKGGCRGDVFTFLEQFEGLDFKAALERLGGRDAVSDPALVEKAKRDREARAAEAARREAQEREAERAKAYEIFKRGLPTGGTVVDDYFAVRGLEPIVTPVLRLLPNEPYWFTDGEKPEVIHIGPAMMAAIQRADGKFIGVHLTWIDMNQLGGKARILAPDGTRCNSKKIKGLALGGAIRLVTPESGLAVLIVGEGIETTLSVFQALQKYGRQGPYAAWCGVSLSNISGGGLGPSSRHPDGKGWVPSSEPDPNAPGLMPPEWAKSAILLGDGDSEPLMTRARLTCAQKRWAGVGYPTELRFAPEGVDFNDLVQEVGE